MARKLKNITTISTKGAANQAWEEMGNWIAWEIWAGAYMAENPGATLRDAIDTWGNNIEIVRKWRTTTKLVLRRLEARGITFSDNTKGVFDRDH